MKSILDKSFHYTQSHSTDIRKRFDEERDKIKAKFKAEQERSEALIEQAKEIAAEADRVVAKTKIKGKAA